jgi:hypothetical protein
MRRRARGVGCECMAYLMRIGSIMVMCGMGVMFTGVRQECGGKTFRANLQRDGAIPAGHEATRNERAERVRNYEEACKPPTLA